MKPLVSTFSGKSLFSGVFFNIQVDKDVVRRVLATHYKPEPGSGGPSWLTFLGYSKDSLWSVDLFRCESIILRSHWVMVVMDQYSRRIIGFAVHAGTVDGPTLCSMFNRTINGMAPPRYLSSDNDPLFTFHRWQANLRILDVMEVKSVPYVPLSHPFIERLIGTLRREFLDHVPFWGTVDLERKLEHFKQYYNTNRTHRALDGTPVPTKYSIPDLNSLYIDRNIDFNQRFTQLVGTHDGDHRCEEMR